MYMSYCRFEGTNSELRTCLSKVEECINGESEYPVSEKEITNFRDMVLSMVEFLQGHYILDEDGEVNAEILDEVCEYMRHPFVDEEQEPEYDKW